MKRPLAAIAATLALCSCTLTGIVEAPRPGDAIKDARTAMEAARKTCRVSVLEVWLSPYRWHVERQGGLWHVRVPTMDGSLNHAYAEVDLRAADGIAPKPCVQPFNLMDVIVASAR